MHRIGTLTCAGGATIAAIAAPSLGQASFTRLGTLPGYIAAFRPQVTADGQWVVGTCWNEGPGSGASFRWSQATGMQSVSAIVGSPVGSFVAISPDGTALTGSCEDPFSGYTVAYRWRQLGGLQILGSPAGNIFSEGTGVSNNGGVVIGEGDSNFTQFRWTQSTGMQIAQPVVPGSVVLLSAVSADGTVIVGVEDSGIPPGDPFRAYRWAAGTAPAWLPGPWSMATAVSADGAVIAGSTVVTGAWVPCIWTAGIGPRLLTPVGGWPHSEATAMSADGTTVVGSLYGSPISAPSSFMWREALGMVDLRDYLAHLGADVQGWSDLYPSGVDADGRTIVGSGTYTGHGQVWVARLSVPACYANCDGSSEPPILNFTDFECFLTAFAAGDPYANCDGSTMAPYLNVLDFVCFLNKFAMGCD